MQTNEVEAKNQQSTIKNQTIGGKDKGRSLIAALSGGLQCNDDGCGGNQGNSRGLWLQ